MANVAAAEAPRSIPAAAERQGLVAWAASKFGVDAGKVFPILKATCFKGEVDKQTGEIKQASDAEVAALMIVAREHGLNPFLKEIYAFPDKKGGIVPVVGVDGWIRIINSHPEFNGVDFEYEKTEGTPAWIECHMYRKDRTYPIKVREFLAECKRDTGPWKSHPSRMLRHKTLIQCARVAFGFAGIFDEDEAERIIEGSAVHENPAAAAATPQRGAAGLKQALLAGDGINLETTASSESKAEPKTAAKAEQAGGKQKGTLAILEKYLKLYREATTLEALADFANEASLYQWTDPDSEELLATYNERVTALQPE